jgi:hypothetical protein
MVPWGFGFGCVGQNLEKEVKFDLMTGQGQKRSLEGQGLRSLALKNQTDRILS